MRLKYSNLKPLLKRGAVLRDAKFVFPDGEVDAKWIVLLTGEVENGHIFCLTTSQRGTYKNSIVPHYISKNTAVFDITPSIIETQRIDIVETKTLEAKYNCNDLEYKGCLSSVEIEAISELIYDDKTISEILKQMICLEYYN